MDDQPKALTPAEPVTEAKNEPTPPPILAQSTKPMHFKDRGMTNVMFDFQRDFGFIPRQFHVRKIKGQNNRFVFSAIVPPEMVKAEQERKQQEIQQEVNKKLKATKATKQE
jgi:hypothetical protein